MASKKPATPKAKAPNTTPKDLIKGYGTASKQAKAMMPNVKPATPAPKPAPKPGFLKQATSYIGKSFEDSIDTMNNKYQNAQIEKARQEKAAAKKRGK